MLDLKRVTVVLSGGEVAKWLSLRMKQSDPRGLYSQRFSDGMTIVSAAGGVYVDLPERSLSSTDGVPYLAEDSTVELSMHGKWVNAFPTMDALVAGVLSRVNVDCNGLANKATNIEVRVERRGLEE